MFIVLESEITTLILFLNYDSNISRQLLNSFKTLTMLFIIWSSAPLRFVLKQTLFGCLDNYLGKKSNISFSLKVFKFVSKWYTSVLLDVIYFHRTFTKHWNMDDYIYENNDRSFNHFPFTDASATKSVWKYCGKCRNCSLWANSPFATMFLT